MPAWTAFASVAGVVTALLLLLAHATSQGLDDLEYEPLDAEAHVLTHRERVDETDADRTDSRTADGNPTHSRERAGSSVDGVNAGSRMTGSGGGDSADSVPMEAGSDASDSVSMEAGSDASDSMSMDSGSGASASAESMSAWMVLANVALTHGVFGVVLVVAAVAAAIPPGALGVATADVSVAWAVVGLALGVALYAIGEVGAGVAADAGFEHSETLRELLAPETPVGWVVLLVGVLPVVAGFEELLFRAILVGAFAAGFDVPLALLVLASSLAFGLGHGAQGYLGIAVTTGFGVVLAVAFLASGSLLVVVVAHYVVNALEFIVHEGLDADWATRAN